MNENSLFKAFLLLKMTERKTYFNFTLDILFMLW